jgi:hypothetical protein
MEKLFLDWRFLQLVIGDVILKWSFRRAQGNGGRTQAGD